MPDETTNRNSADDRQRLVASIQCELERLEDEWDLMRGMRAMDPPQLERMAANIEAVRARLQSLTGNYGEPPGE